MQEPKPSLRRKPKKGGSKLVEVIKTLMLTGIFSCVLVVGFVINQSLSQGLKEKKRQQWKLGKELSRFDGWVEKKQDYQTLEWVLAEKMRIIDELETRRGNAVTLLQDLADDLPGSVRLGSVTQGFTASQVAAMTKTHGWVHFPDEGGAEKVQVKGFGQSIESITRYGNRIQAHSKYWRLKMNKMKRQQETVEYSFEFSFRVRLSRF